MIKEKQPLETCILWLDINSDSSIDGLHINCCVVDMQPGRLTYHTLHPILLFTSLLVL
jgi:hypothetical protein